MARVGIALEAFEAIARQDPKPVEVAGTAIPRELFDARARVRWLDRLAPEASEALRLAVFATHLGRHRLPRASRPLGRAGYLAWRREQK